MLDLKYGYKNVWGLALTVICKTSSKWGSRTLFNFIWTAVLVSSKINWDRGGVFWKNENPELYAIVKDISYIYKHRQNGKMSSVSFVTANLSFTIACYKWVTVHLVLLVYVKLLLLFWCWTFSLPSLINFLFSRCFHHQHTLDVWQRLEKKVKVIKIFIYIHTSLTFHICNI